jgi:hypothetical protein
MLREEEKAEGSRQKEENAISDLRFEVLPSFLCLLPTSC